MEKVAKFEKEKGIKIIPASGILFWRVNPANEELEILLANSNATKGKHYSLFPGGKVDNSDKNPLTALVREVQEELGLEPDTYIKDTRLIDVFLPKQFLDKMKTKAYLVFVFAPNKEAILESEVEKFSKLLNLPPEQIRENFIVIDESKIGGKINIPNADEDSDIESVFFVSPSNIPQNLKPTILTTEKLSEEIYGTPIKNTLVTDKDLLERLLKDKKEFFRKMHRKSVSDSTS